MQLRLTDSLYPALWKQQSYAKVMFLENIGSNLQGSENASSRAHCVRCPVLARSHVCSGGALQAVTNMYLSVCETGSWLRLHSIISWDVISFSTSPHISTALYTFLELLLHSILLCRDDL